MICPCCQVRRYHGESADDHFARIVALVRPDLRARLAKAEAGQAAAEEQAKRWERECTRAVAEEHAIGRDDIEAAQARAAAAEERAKEAIEKAQFLAGARSDALARATKAEERAKALEAALRHPSAALSDWMCARCGRWLYDGADNPYPSNPARPCSCDPLRALLAASAADPEVFRG